MQENSEIFESSIQGSELDKFIRRCLISCAQMMFENFVTLYEQYLLFSKEQPYQYLHSTVQLENWSESTARNLENMSIHNN